MRSPATAPQGPAQLILHHGKFITVNPEFTIAQAVAIRDGKFLAVGTDEEVRKCSGSNTRFIDLEGQTAVPGVVDSHNHPVLLGKNLLQPIQMDQVRTAADALAAVGRGVKKAAPGEWLVTSMNWPIFDMDRYPTASELDSVAPLNPVWVQVGVHRGIANTMALGLAGISKESVSAPGGRIFKDPATGELTGRLDETAMKPVTRLLPRVNLVEALEKACSYYNSIGVTAISADGLDPEELHAFLKLKALGRLTMRCILLEWFDPTEGKEALFSRIRTLAGAGLGTLGNDLLKLVGIKTFNEDLQSGEPLWPKDLLEEVLLEAAKQDLRVAIHSNAKANEENLRIYQSVNRRYPIGHLRWAIIHQRLTTPDLIKINKQLGLVVNQDLGFGLLSIQRLDRGRKERLPHMLYCPIPLYLKEGVPVSFNSDSGGACTELSVWSAVWISTERERWPDMGKDYSISRTEALRILTMGGATRLMMEGQIGSIEPGKLADLCVLSADPLTCSGDQLREMRAVTTVLDGRVVYSTRPDLCVQ